MMTTHKKRKRPSKPRTRAPKESKHPTGQASTVRGREKKSESDSPVKCAFCRGTGFDRFGVPSKLSKCQTCQGRGRVYVPEPHEKCPSCLGTGVYRHHRLTCSVCGGKGRVRALNRTRGEGCEKVPRSLSATGMAAAKSGLAKNEEALDVNTGLPCISAYELGEVEEK